jgi:hypothetical protein
VLGEGNRHQSFKETTCLGWMLGGTNWAPWITWGKIFGEAIGEELVKSWTILGGMFSKVEKSSSFTKQNTFFHFGHT